MAKPEGHDLLTVTDNGHGLRERTVEQIIRGQGMSQGASQGRY